MRCQIFWNDKSFPCFNFLCHLPLYIYSFQFTRQFAIFKLDLSLQWSSILIRKKISSAFLPVKSGRSNYEKKNAFVNVSGWNKIFVISTKKRFSILFYSLGKSQSVLADIHQRLPYCQRLLFKWSFRLENSWILLFYTLYNYYRT